MDDFLVLLLLALLFFITKESKLQKDKKDKVIELLFVEIQEERQENLNLHVPLIQLNSIVDDCWSCKKKKKGNKRLSNQILELV